MSSEPLGKWSEAQLPEPKRWKKVLGVVVACILAVACGVAAALFIMGAFS